MAVDRRIQRTKTLLRDALVALILEQGYERVKVAHITDRANLARATFYLHFKDKDDLLIQSIYAVFDELLEQLGAINSQMLLQFDPDVRKLPFEHVQQYRDVFRVALMSPVGITSITNKSRVYISGHMQRQLERLQPEPLPHFSLAIAANYLAGALMAVISWWLEEGEDCSAVYMADMFYKLSSPTLNMIFGMNPPPPPGN